MGKERSTATNQQSPSSPSLNLIPLVHLPPPYLSSCQKSLYSLHHIDRHLTRTTPWFVHSNIERDSELFPFVSVSPSFPLLFKFVPFSLPLISILPSKLKSFTCAIVQILDCSSWLKFYRDLCYTCCSFVTKWCKNRFFFFFCNIMILESK